MNATEDPVEGALDAALEMTFPASDPIAVYVAESVAGEIIAKPPQLKRSIDASPDALASVRLKGA